MKRKYKQSAELMQINVGSYQVISAIRRARVLSDCIYKIYDGHSHMNLFCILNTFLHILVLCFKILS